MFIVLCMLQPLHFIITNQVVIQYVFHKNQVFIYTGLTDMIQIFPHDEDYALFEKLNEDIALNILHVPYEEKQNMSRVHIKTQF